jgi:hypothetical protein
MEPHIGPVVITRAVGQTFITTFHSVTCQLQMLAGAVVDVVQGPAIKKPDSCSNPLLRKNQTI